MTKIVTKADTVIPKTVIPKVVRVNAFWDAEAGVWCAQSTNMPEVITDAPTIAVLREYIAEIIELFAMDEDDAPDTVRVVLTVKHPVNGVVVPELAAATKALARLSCANKTRTDLAPPELIFKQPFKVENGVAKL